MSARASSPISGSSSRGRRAVWIAALMLMMVWPAAAGSTPGVARSRADRPYANPIKAQKGADPWLQYDAGA
jgi:hypothetical protein